MSVAWPGDRQRGTRVHQILLVIPKGETTMRSFCLRLASVLVLAGVAIPAGTCALAAAAQPASAVAQATCPAGTNWDNAIGACD
jgi:hypothetical protein